MIGDHVPTTVADIVYTENDSSCMASLAPITSTIKVARTTLFDYVKYPKGIDHPSHEWLSNRYTVRYCPYHVGRNEYTLQAPTRPKQLALKCKSQTSTREGTRLPYIYRGYGRPLPDRSSDLLPEPAEWKPEEPQASARDKVDNWNAGTNAGIVNPNVVHDYEDESHMNEAFHTRQASEVEIYGLPSFTCASSKSETIGQSTPIPADLLSLAGGDCTAMLEEQPVYTSLAGDLLGLVFDATQGSCVPDSTMRTDNRTSDILDPAETIPIPVPLSVIDNNLDLKHSYASADWTRKSSKSRVTKDTHDRAESTSIAIDEDLHSAYSTDDEFFDARQSPNRTRNPLKLVRNRIENSPPPYESVEERLSDCDNLAHKRLSSIQPYSHPQMDLVDIIESPSALTTHSPSIKEDVHTGTKHHTMRQGSGRAKKGTRLSTVAGDATNHLQTMNKGLEQSDEVSKAFDSTVKEVSGFADELSNDLEIVMNNMRSYDGLCTLEARLGRILIENVNPLQVADDSTARGVPLKMMVDYLQTTEASFTSVLTEKHSEIQDLVQRSANPAWQTTSSEYKVTYEIFAASTLHKETFVLEIDAESFEVAVFRQEAFAEINVHCALRNWDFRITAGGKKDLVERYQDFVNEILDSIYVV